MVNLLVYGQLLSALNWGNPPPLPQPLTSQKTPTFLGLIFLDLFVNKILVSMTQIILERDIYKVKLGNSRPSDGNQNLTEAARYLLFSFEYDHNSHR